MTSRTKLFEDPRAVLKRHGLRPKRALSQNFLISERAVRTIAERCADEPGRRVIEIGAGAGTLTGALLGRGAAVTAIERDPELCAVLRAELGAHDALGVVEGDAAEHDYGADIGAGPAVIAGNLPYQITGLLLRRVSAVRHGLLRAVLMIQAEVADRVCAGPGERERAALSVLIQSRMETRVVLRLAPTAFAPPPKVRSAVLELTPHPEPLHGELDDAAFDAAVKAAFAGRRKTIRNSLIAATGQPADRVAALLGAAGIDPGQRAQQLENLAFVALARAGAEDRNWCWQPAGRR
jgi:16S rRNA (adenine1518-N6/adenine1519-N6)-dimethyltransferase